MRIAYLTQTYPPMVSGAAIFAQQLARSMANRGHQVLVITSSDWGHGYQCVEGNLTVKRLRSIPNLLRKSQRLTIAPHYSIMAALRQFKPDIIHTHDPLQFALSAVQYARAYQVPITLTIHQVPWFASAYIKNWHFACKIIEQSLWRYAGWLAKYFTAIYTPSHTIAELVEKRISARPGVITIGVDTRYFNANTEKNASIREKVGVPANLPVILHVGRLDKDKNAVSVICAAAKAMAGNDAHLVVVGDGTERARLAKKCFELGIGERSHFTGFISPEKGLPDIYREASVFVTASEIETQGIVLLEAAACGVPIVAVEASCIHETVKNGVNGWLVQPGDLHEMALCIQKLVSSPQNAREMGLNGARMAGELNIEKSCSSYETAYKEIVRKWEVASFVPAPDERGHAKHSAWYG